MTPVAVHPAYPPRQVLLDGIAAARAAIADQDQALALIEAGVQSGAIPDADAAQMLGEVLGMFGGETA